MADQLTQLFNIKSDSSLISGFTYQMDSTGNRTNVLEGTGDRVTWTYDATNQLTSERRSGTNAYFHTFVYDSVGNRLVKNEDGTRASYTYDVASQLATAVDQSGTAAYAFDMNGNQQIVVEPPGQRSTWVWDYENHPVLVVLSSGFRITMTYNAIFRRVRREE